MIATKETEVKTGIGKPFDLFGTSSKCSAEDLDKCIIHMLVNYRQYCHNDNFNAQGFINFLKSEMAKQGVVSLQGLYLCRITTEKPFAIDNMTLLTSTEKSRSRKKCTTFRGKRPSSQYRGVSWNSINSKWKARIHVDGKQIYLGTFCTEFDAAWEYNKAMFKQFGTKAKLNQLSNDMNDPAMLLA